MSDGAPDSSIVPVRKDTESAVNLHGQRPTTLRIRARNKVLLKVVDTSDQPLANVVLAVTGEDGRQVVVTTDGAGQARAEVVPGTFSLTSPASGSTLSHTFDFVSMGASGYSERGPATPRYMGSMQDLIALVRRVEAAYPSWLGDVTLNVLRTLAGYGDKNFQIMLGTRQAPDLKPVKAKAFPAGSGTRYAIAKVVRFDGNGTLTEAGERHGVSYADVARFNFASADPKKVEEGLRTLVGCRQKNAAGQLIVHMSDVPGTVYVPAPWREEGLSTEQAHTIRVARVSHDEVWTLSQDHIDQLRQLVAHEGSDPLSLGSPLEAERGIVPDETGRLVAIGHVLCGISAALHRVRSFDPETLAAGGGIVGWLKRIATDVGVGENMDNLYAVTLAGDLGQTAVLHEHDPTTTLIGPGSEASWAELTGDVDGVLWGELLSGEARGLRRAAKLSDLLEGYYAASPSGAFAIVNSKTRFQAFQQHVSMKTVEKEAKAFATNFGYKEQGGGALTTDYDPACDQAVREFQGWLDGGGASGRFPSP